MIETGSNLQIFFESIRSAMADVLSKAFSSAWKVEIEDSRPSEAPVADAARIAFGLPISGSLRGDAAVLTSSAAVLLLAQRIRREPEPAQELDAERKKTVEELLRQVAGLAANAMRVQFGEVKIEVN